MTGGEAYYELLKEIGEIIHNKNLTISVQGYEIERLKKRVAELEAGKEAQV